MKKNTKIIKNTAKKVTKPANNKASKSNSWSSSEPIPINQLINEESKQNYLEIETIKWQSKMTFRLGHKWINNI